MKFIHADVRPPPVPEDAAGREMAERHARTSGDGIRFRERMVTARSRHRPAGARTLSLFPRDGGEAMRYLLEFSDDHGAPWWLTGVKTFRPRSVVAAWFGLTRLHWEAGPAAVVGPPLRGIVSLGPAAVLHLLTTIRGEGFTRPRRIAVVARFAAFFVREALHFALDPRTP